MAQVINTNIASLNAQRNLNNTQGQLNTTLQRLSTGLRVNTAKDDAAGLAIAERFTAQINGLNQAIRNANDGISYAQTAEGALIEVNNLLQRIRVLSVQSTNDTNSPSDREALNQEVQQAVREINRIAHNTQFNNRNVLDGTLADLIFQVGANSGQTIAATGIDSRGSQLGAVIADTVDFRFGDQMVGAERYDMGAITGNINAANSSMTVNGVNVPLDGTPGIDDLDGSDDDEKLEIAEKLQTLIRNQLDAEYGPGTGAGYRVIFDGTGYVFLNATGKKVEIDLSINNDATALDTKDTDIYHPGFQELGIGNLDFTQGTPDSGIDASDVSLRINGAIVNLDPGFYETASPDLIEELRTQIRAELDSQFGSIPGFDEDNFEIIYDATEEKYIFLNRTGQKIDIDLSIKDQADPVNEVTLYSTLIGDFNDTGNPISSVYDYLDRPGNSLDFRVDITGTDGSRTSIKIDDARSLSDILGQINARTTETGITAFLTPNGKDISFTSEYGQNFSVDITSNLENKPMVTGTHPDDTFYVDDFDVTTVEKANRTMMAVDYAISQVTGFRAVLGAIQNRFESNVANLRVGSENMTASRSRIQDADFAAETAELTRNQILQQAGTSVLAQANQLPQTVLQLLQN